MIDKHFRRLEAKIDALLEQSGLDPAQFGGSAEKQDARAQPELTAAQQDAISNAPKAGATVPKAEGGVRVTQQNAPDTSSSVPAVPQDAVGSVTVETKEQDGDVTVDTMPASEAKKGKE